LAFYETDEVLSQLKRHDIDFIVLAGFLWLLPNTMVHSYSGRILNIHPALLPAFGGKGMYGNRVHEAVIKSGTGESGITVHVVNEVYDDGEIIFTKTIGIEPGETAESLSGKIRKLEHEWYPQVVEAYVLRNATSPA
jgi:phosphoribosylglycinamide formyltransferase-1